MSSSHARWLEGALVARQNERITFVVEGISLEHQARGVGVLFLEADPYGAAPPPLERWLSDAWSPPVELQPSGHREPVKLPREGGSPIRLLTAPSSRPSGVADELVITLGPVLDVGRSLG